jgi:hypothetical protein
MPDLTPAEREALLAIVKDIRAAADEEAALVLMAAAVVAGMQAAIERYGTGAWFEPAHASAGISGKMSRFHVKTPA